MSGVQLYHGDCLDILPELSADVSIVTDPPYGIGLRTDYRSRKRGCLAQCNDFAPITGDGTPFDPAPLLRFKTIVLFGANWYADRLPISGGWIIWDKLDGLKGKRELGFNDNSDCELIWTNVGNVARIIRHRWMGAMKASERTERRLHPTQKPVTLMEMIIRHYAPPDIPVVDPYMGVGSTGMAAVLQGRDFIGIEIDESYFEIAQKRIARAQMQLRLGGL